MEPTPERRKFTAEQLADILAKHKAWRRGEAEGARADLAGADLADADLADADLADADLADAYLAGANLAGAYLAGAYLAGADLAGADLADADLAGANLAGAYLAGAYLAGANLAGANLADANLADADLAGANLADANLAGANLAGANLADAKNMPGDVTKADPPTPYVRKPRAEHYAERARRYRKRHPDVPVVEQLDAKILAAIEAGHAELEMGSWHGEGGACGTTHCRAGFAVAIAGAGGRKLEDEFGPENAGRMIYLASTGRVPHFYATNERALEDIRACAAEQTAAPAESTP